VHDDGDAEDTARDGYNDEDKKKEEEGEGEGKQCARRARSGEARSRQRAVMSLGRFVLDAATARFCLGRLEEDREWMVEKLAQIVCKLVHNTHSETEREEVRVEAEGRVREEMEAFDSSRSRCRVRRKAPLIRSLLHLVSLCTKSRTTWIEGAIEQMKRFVVCV